MPELTSSDIARITGDVRRQEITFSHLPEDLIDHICCDVENEMEKGLSFDDAYRNVRLKIPTRRLKEIQEETLFAVDTKYRRMKNTMKISGVTGTILFGAAALFKLEHWMGAGIMMTLGGIILSFVFMPSALGVLWKETHSKKRLFLFISAFFASIFFILGTLFKVQHWDGAGFLLILGAVSGIILFIPALAITRYLDQDNKSKRPVYLTGALGSVLFAAGFVFKIQHWPSAEILLVSGVIVLCIVTLPWYTFMTWRNEERLSPRFLFIVIAAVLIILPGMLINLNFQYSYEDQYFTHLSRQKALFNLLYSRNNAAAARYHDSLTFPEIGQIHDRTKELLDMIGSVEVKLVRESDGKPEMSAPAGDKIKMAESGPVIDYRLLSGPFLPGPVRSFLMPGCPGRKELDASLREYTEFISGILKNKENQVPAGTDNLTGLLPDETGKEGNISLLSGLHSLELLKVSILNLESNAISVLINRK